MIVYRASEDYDGFLEGSCISEAQYENVYFADKVLWDRIEEFERMDMIEYQDEVYFAENGIQCLLFYTESELNNFLEKRLDNGILD